MNFAIGNKALPVVLIDSYIKNYSFSSILPRDTTKYLVFVLFCPLESNTSFVLYLITRNECYRPNYKPDIECE